MTMLNPYEIHITVNYSNNDDIEHFKNICSLIGAKPLLLDLHFYRQNTEPSRLPLHHLMTNSKFSGDFTSAMRYAQDMGTRLYVNGFTVTRIKIETTPANPELSTRSGKSHSDFGIKAYYHEAHMKIELKDPECAPWDALKNYIESSYQQLCRVHRPVIALPRLSNNSLKSDDGSLSRTLTWRTTGGRASSEPDEKGEYGFSKVVDRSIEHLISTFNAAVNEVPELAAFKFGKVSREVVAYDSNRSLDNIWAPT